MTRSIIPTLWLLAACSASGPAPTPAPAPASAPVSLAQPEKWPGTNYAFRQGDGFYFAGQPSAEGLRHAAAQGIKTVINLRDDAQEDVSYDEAALAKELGMAYRHVPIDATAFTRADVAAFGRLLKEARGPVLIHCRSSNRVGALWASHLVREGRIAAADAAAHGEAAGMRSPATIERMRVVNAELKALRDAE